MGKHREIISTRPDFFALSTAPPSPSASSSSSSDFEFIVSLSPTKKPSHLCPADELFYRGQLLPLSLSPRVHLLRSLVNSSSSSSSSDTTTSPRDSNGSSNDSSSYCSERNLINDEVTIGRSSLSPDERSTKKQSQNRKPNYFSLFTSVFPIKERAGSMTPRRIRDSAKEVIRKYMNKVKPLVDRFSSRNSIAVTCSFPVRIERTVNCNLPLPSGIEVRCGSRSSSSLARNLRYTRKGRNPTFAASCPSSMRSSPSHSGLLRRTAYADSSMEELQNAIQGAIAHCKNSMAVK